MPNHNQPVTPELHREIYQLGQQKPRLSNREIGRRLHIHDTTVLRYRDSAPGPVVEEEEVSPPELEQKIKAMLAKHPASAAELAEGLDMRPSERKRVEAILDGLRGQGAMLTQRADGRYSLDREVEPGGKAEHQMADRGDGWTVLGFTADNHLCSKHERLDVLKSLYDIFASEGVKDVYNGGNWIEGESRLNKHDIKVFGLDDQVEYFLEHYPQRQGITTHYVSGDDHEGWFTQRDRVNIGRYVELKAEAGGRTDLKYLGNVEADIALKCGNGSVPMKVMHGGGGNAYALSYVLQKTVEAFQGGEKPALLCLGHHHKFDYCYPRNVHAFMPGCTEDQSIFMRKRKIEAHVGGVLAWLKQDPTDGHILRCRIEWIPFYDRKFYERRYE